MTNDVGDMPEFKNRASIELMLNAELIKQGYGHAYTKYPFKYLEQFRKYEKQVEIRKEGVHFDIAHRNRIEWVMEDLVDLKLKLTNRIKAIIV